MNLQFDLIEDKIEFFGAADLKTLEKKIATQIEINKAIMLRVHSVSHQMHVNEEGKPYFSAAVHFKLKK
ncbi:YrzA family protein [Bacillus sp. FJAT-27245]|uniref:YrzA family protein n=1 Tax=Bacillus sp. FJAT-27245 TaxID=1684144 RepID=UPI0006A7A12B|nr:YrzA family protein [Bacillus sp. FJAT-27245]